MLAALVLAAVVLGAAGCSEEKDDELSGPFGSGSGGPAVTLPATNYPLTVAGSALGSLEFDGLYFTVPGTLPALPDTLLALIPAALLGLQNPGGDLLLLVTPIFGRADTPCRFTAALLARDDGYGILGSGDRVNDNGLEFHQVDLVKGDTYLGFYCVLLRRNAGIQIGGISFKGNRLGNRQVHFVLNSVSP